MENGYISLIGLGAIGTPLAHLLYKKYQSEFILLADEQHAKKLREKDISINGDKFAPGIVDNRNLLHRPIKVVFVCVKNYSLETTCDFLDEMIDIDTVILPLQNGVYSYRYMCERFPNNIILEGFAQGPNTKITCSGFEYQNPGVYHVGTSCIDYRGQAKAIYDMLRVVGIQCYLDENIRHAVWKKLMLNVAGNALTAITEMDYSMFKNSIEAQMICRTVMQEFAVVAKSENINISESDIEDIMKYFMGYKESKNTSMLEDVLHRRQTENEYIAGYIKRLADEKGIDAPYINMLYLLMKIKQDVYLKRL